MIMTGPNDDKQGEVGASSAGDVGSPTKGNLEGDLSRLDEFFGKESPKEINRDFASVSSSSKSRRLSERLAGRVSKFNANPTDGCFLSPMQSSLKKPIPNSSMLRPLSFSPEPRRLQQTKKIQNRIKNFDGSSSTNNVFKIDLRSPQDVKKLVASSKGNQRLGEILNRYEKLVAGSPQERRELAYKMAARERHRHYGSSIVSVEEKARLLRQNQARFYRSGSERILETEDSSQINAGGDGLVADNVWAVECDFTDFVPPSFPKNENQRNMILGVIDRSFVFAEFRKYGRARCEGALEMLVDAFESVTFPSGHALLETGMTTENDHFYLLERGRIDFEIEGRLVAQIDEVSGYFGELSLLHNVVNQRRVVVYGSSGRAAKLLKINQKIFRGLLNTCSKRATQEKREALLSVDFLSDIITGNEKIIRQLSSIMIREEMELDGAFSLSQDETFVVIRSGRIKITNSNDIFDSGDHFGSQALIKSLSKSSQNDVDIVARSEKVVIFRIENHAMGLIVGKKRLQNLMDMRKFANTPLMDKPNLSSDDRVTKETSNTELGYAHSSALQQRARVQEVVESNIAFEDLEKIRLLGEGEFGEVWLVSADVLPDNSRTTRQKFALKTQHITDINRGLDATDAILREIQMMKELNHPQIVDIVTTYQDETSIHMLMRLVPYGELWERMHVEDDDGNWSSGLTDDAAKFYSISIADTLDFIHSRNIIYRDLKPENVLIDVDGYPVIVDFGCSKFCPDKSYTFIGTPNYVAPEMITNAGHSKGVDIWAFGVMVYEMVTGENPFFFEGMDRISLYHGICHEEYFPLPKDKSKECVDFIDKLLKKDPLQRLGMLHAGINDIIRHRWFDGIELEQIRTKTYPAPWKPKEIILDGFESFRSDRIEFSQTNNSSFSMNESISIISNDETEVQELSQSSLSKTEQVQDSFSSAGDIPKISNSSRSSFVSTEDTREIKETNSRSNLEDTEELKPKFLSKLDDIRDPKPETKRKKKPKKSKSQPRARSKEEHNAYNDPSEFRFKMRNPTIRQTKSQKMERRTRRDLLKTSLNNFGILDDD